MNAQIIVYENAALDTGTALPSLTTPKWRVDAFGLVITQPLSYDEWVECGRVIWQHRQASAWAVGDFFAYGEDKFSEDVAQALSLAEYSEQTIANKISVSRAFPMSRRKYRLSHSHYDAARGFRDLDGQPDREAQNAVLALCEKEGLGREVVREAARTYRAELLPNNDDPPALPHGGNDAPPSKLPPTYDELLALARWIAFVDVDKLLNFEIETLIEAWQCEARKLVGELDAR